MQLLFRSDVWLTDVEVIIEPLLCPYLLAGAWDPAGRCGKAAAAAAAAPAGPGAGSIRLCAGSRGGWEDKPSPLGPVSGLGVPLTE